MKALVLVMALFNAPADEQELLLEELYQVDPVLAVDLLEVTDELARIDAQLPRNIGNLRSPGSRVGFNPQPQPPGRRVGFNPQPQPPGRRVGFKPQPQPPGRRVGFNPQPQPPGRRVGFNPQPQPPGHRVGFNPQPQPPGHRVGIDPMGNNRPEPVKYHRGF